MYDPLKKQADDFQEIAQVEFICSRGGRKRRRRRRRKKKKKKEREVPNELSEYRHKKCNCSLLKMRFAVGTRWIKSKHSKKRRRDG